MDAKNSIFRVGHNLNTHPLLLEEGYEAAPNGVGNSDRTHYGGCVRTPVMHKRGQPLLLSTEVLGTTTAHCLDKAEQTLIQFGAGLPIFKNGDLRVAGLGAGGTVAVYCLPNGNPNQVQVVIAVATAQLGPGQSLLTNFVHDFEGNVRNPL